MPARLLFNNRVLASVLIGTFRLFSGSVLHVEHAQAGHGEATRRTDRPGRLYIRTQKRWDHEGDKYRRDRSRRGKAHDGPVQRSTTTTNCIFKHPDYAWGKQSMLRTIYIIHKFKYFMFINLLRKSWNFHSATKKIYHWTATVLAEHDKENWIKCLHAYGAALSLYTHREEHVIFFWQHKQSALCVWSSLYSGKYILCIHYIQTFLLSTTSNAVSDIRAWFEPAVLMCTYM